MGIRLDERYIQRFVKEYINTLITEGENSNIVYDIMNEYNPEDLLFEFLDNKEHGIKTIQLNLIPAEQYKNLVNRFMSIRHPSMARIPDNIVDKWIEWIAANLVKMDYTTAFMGHSQWFPSDAMEYVFGDENEIDWSDFYEAYGFLEHIGFDDWCKLPDGSPACSDYGLKPIYNILDEYNPNMESWEKLLLINRVLNVTHCNGDLASAFIEGGSKTCSDISGQMHNANEAIQKFLHLTESKDKLLTESATDKFIDKLIFSKLPDQLKQYINMPVNELIAKRPDLVDAQSLGTTQEELKKMGNLPLNDFIRLSISKMFDIGHGKGPKKYLRGIFRIVLDEINYLQHPDQNAIQNLKNDVMYVMQASQNGSDEEAMQLDGNFNGLSGSQLHNMFMEKRKAFAKSVRDKVSSMFGKGGKSDYKVVPILRHEDAMKYAPYTSWCITYKSPANYDQYVQGGRRFYVFLRNGFENVGKRVGEGCPMDEYGLSMISVLVDMEGNIDYITTRWNHDHDGEFHNPDTETIQAFQNVIGMDLYGVCKPYSREELKAMGITPFDEVQELLDSGIDPEEIFSDVDEYEDSFAVVKLNNKYNFVSTEGKLLSEQWFDNAWCFREGSAKVKLDGKWNFISTEGKILSEQWFDFAWGFSEGFAVVELDGKWNFIDTEGKLLSEQWFDDAWFFSEGFAWVELDGKSMYIDRNGKFYDSITQEGKVFNKNRVFVLTESQVELLTEALTADELYSQYYNDLDKSVFDAAVKADPTSKNKKPGKYVKWILNLAKKGEWKTGDSYETKDALTMFSKFGGKLQNNDIGQYKSVKELLDATREFRGKKTNADIKHEATKAYEDGEWLIVIPHTEEAAKKYGANTRWCTAADNDNMFDYYNGHGPLYININKQNGKKYQFQFETDQFMDEEDEEVSVSDIGLSQGAINYYVNKGYSVMQYPYISAFTDGWAYVQNEDRLWNMSRANGNLLLEEWCDKIETFYLGIAVIQKDNKFNLVSQRSGLLLDDWMDDIDYNWSFRIARVKLNGKYNLIGISDKHNTPIIPQWVDGIRDVYSIHNKIVYKTMIENKFKLFSIGRYVQHGDYEFDIHSSGFYEDTGNTYYHVGNNDELLKVQKGGKYNYIDLYFRPLFEIWFDYISNFKDNNAFGMVNDEWFDLDIWGNIEPMEEKRKKMIQGVMSRTGLQTVKNESMNRTFVITEKQKRKLMSANKQNKEIKLSERQFYTYINESLHPKAGLVLHVKDFMDRNFQRSTVSDIDNNGYPSTEKCVVWIGANGEPVKSMNMAEFLDLLDDRFHDSIRNNSDRKEFLKQVIIDWYGDNISKDGLLTVNTVGKK